MIYRSMNVEQQGDQWFWFNPSDAPPISYGPFATDDDAMSDIDRHRRAQLDREAGRR